MEKFQNSKKVIKCANCKVTLTTFIGYIPGKGEVCINCFNEYAKAEDNKLVTRTGKPKQ
jgi:hypothetical protein